MNDEELIHMANIFIENDVRKRHGITFYQFIQEYKINRHERYLLGVGA